jgi:hypothetical protein
MKPTDSRQGYDLASGWRHHHAWSATRCVLPQSEMSTVFVVQVDNATPIILNREKSVTFGILGTCSDRERTPYETPMRVEIDLDCPAWSSAKSYWLAGTTRVTCYATVFQLPFCFTQTIILRRSPLYGFPLTAPLKKIRKITTAVSP